MIRFRNSMSSGSGNPNGGFDFAWHDGTSVMRIINGNVGIGTTDTKGYKLAIAGKTITEEVVVKLQGNWPDYVFEPDYKNPSLADLEQYIQSNGHLPDVPTADDVKANGMPVGEMNAVLLKKVEELTLHLIEINKRMLLLEADNKKQRTKIDVLKAK